MNRFETNTTNKKTTESIWNENNTQQINESFSNQNTKTKKPSVARLAGACSQRNDEGQADNDDADGELPAQAFASIL